jgi:hypothetical protein
LPDHIADCAVFYFAIFKKSGEFSMNNVARWAKKSPRLFASLILIGLVSTLVMASGWDSVSAFARTLGSASLSSPAETVSFRAEMSPKTVNNQALAPLVGTYNIPGDYADLATAIADLNTQGVGGAVTLNLIAGNPQTSPAGGYVIGGTGSLVLTTTSMTNTVTIQGNGNTITAPTTHTVGALTDGIFKLIGADWISITGFNMQENAANTVTTAGTNNMTEFGVALFYVTTTDGAQNNTVTNNTIDLNRTYQNTFGIYANATHNSTTISSGGSATGAAGGNSGLVITANQITDVNMGIVVVGPIAPADNNDGITIGGTVPNANTITNFGTTSAISGYVNVSGTVNGILVRNSKNFTISFNTVTSSVGGVTAGTLNGIQIPGFSSAPTGTFTNNINDNTISLQSGAATAAINGINVPGTSATTTSTLNINNNNFTALNHTVAASGTIQGIINSGSTNGPLNHSISNNTFTNITTNTTGSFTFINNSWSRPASGVGNINNNSIVTGFNKTGAGGTVTLYTSNSTSGPTISEINNNNNFSNITVTGATTIAGWASTDGGSPIKTVTGNTFSNWIGGTSAITGLSVGFSSSSTVSGNIVSNISSAGTITGITSGSGTDTFTQNTVNNLSSSGAAAVTGIANTSGTTKTYTRNKVYAISSSNAGGSASGITVSGGTTVNLQNNIVGDITAPNLNATNSLFGINISGGTTVTADFNTVYLNASSVGANFGSSALSASSTPNVTLRNNVLVNTSTAAGTGFTVAYRRSSTTLTTYNAASNNNDFYAGTPSVTNLIFYDGTNSDQTLANYKARVASRDSNSVSENPPFLSTTGSNANFLHINPAIATQLESGGITVAGITDDFDGDTRNVSTPDIGADEFTGIPLDIVGPSITYTPLGNTAQTTNRTLTATITDASGVAGGSFAPRIYFRKNAGAYVSTQCTGSSPTYNCTIDNSLVGGVAATDVIDYFVIAQDTAGNVSINPGAGASATDVNTVLTPPTTPNTYTIVAPFPSTLNVPGDYPSLTNTGGLFEAMNAGTFTGNTVINITADLTGELGTVALNQLNEDGAGAGTYTVLIRPSGGARTITGSINGALIRLNGADRVRFDGWTGATFADDNSASAVGGNPALRELTIQNTSTGTSAAVVSIASNATNGAQNNTVKNVNILGQDPTTTLLGISLGGATPGTAATGPNNGNRVENCSLKRATFGIYSAGTSAASQNTGTVITQNETSDVTGDRIRRVGILVFNDNGVQITENSLNGISTNESNDAIGIGVGNQAVDMTTVTSGGVSNALVERNKINGVASLSTTGFSAAGITVAGTTGGANTIRNNMITGVTAPSTSPDFPAGIFVVGAAGSSTRIYHNSVAMTGDRGAVASQMPSFGIAVTGTDPTVELKNNIFYTTQTSGGGVNAKSYAIGMVTTTFANLDSNYNDFYSSGANAGFFRSGSLGAGAGTDYPNLAGWQAAISDDANSQELDPAFVNPVNDLHLDGMLTPLLGDGITGFATVDFDGETRDAVPDIGADEIVTAAAGTVQFSSATYSVTEGTPTVTLTVTRTGGSGGAVTVNYTLGGGTATGTAACGTPGEDYVNTGGSVMFADGDAADKTFDVPICSDAVYELNQTFDATLAIGSGSATLGTPNPATVTINNDDAAPTLSVSDVTQAEGDSGTSVFQFVVSLTGATEVVTEADFATADGTATAPGDYTGGGVHLMFNPPTTSLGVNISVNGDTNFEPNETFFGNATNCINCSISDGQGQATIQNDDVQPTVQFSSATYTNSDDIAKNAGKGDDFAPQVATITVTRAGAAGDAFSVNYATSNGTATGGASCGTGSGVDYISTSGTLNFAAGDMSKTFNITVCTDNLFEGDETVNLTLTSPTAPVILGTPNPAVLTLTDNDTQPSLQFSSATYSNSDDIAKFGVTTDEVTPSVATITVTRTGAVDNAVAVNYATSNGTATGGASCTTGVDYISTSGTLNFAAGVVSQTFNVTVCTDALFEGNETVNLTLSNPTGGAALGTPNSAVLTIVDNDAQPSLQFSSATYSVGEGGGTATITVTRTGAPDNGVSVNYATVAGGTAIGGASCGGAVDYQNASGTLSFAAGETSKTFSVTICDDATAETSETVNLALSSPSGGAMLGAPNTAVLTITDNDASPTLQFTTATAAVLESASVNVTVTRTGATGNAVTVDYATSNGTATAGACAPGVDYVAQSGTLTFNPGDLGKSFIVTICNDAVYEANQTFNITLSNATGGAVLGTPSTQTVTINNDDAAPTVAINDISQAEGNSGTTNFQVSVVVSGANEVTGGFNLQTADGTATAPSDYTSVNGAAVIPANVNRTTATLVVTTVSVNGDTAVEPDETFFLNGSSCTDCSFADNQGVATIQNDDVSVQFAQPLYTVSEGVGTVMLTVTRAGTSTGAISVNYAFAGINANGAASCGAGIDFAAVSGTLNWASGDGASKTFNVTICDDALVESTESFISQLQSPTGGATIGAQSSTQVDITDNDSDTTAPTVSYTSLSNVATVQDRVFTVTATDNVGVTAVTVVWRNNDGGVGNFITNPCSFAGGTPQNGTWTCTILSGVGTQTNPGTVDYFVSADDAAANSATNPAGATVNGGTWNLYTIGTGGTINVGTINTFENLVVGSGFTLGGNATVTGNLTLIGGILNTGANTLTLGCTATVTGGGEGNYVVGNLEKQFCSTGSFTFHTGAPFPLPPVAPDGGNLAPEGVVSNYSPVTVNVTGGTVGSSLTVSATDAFLAGSMTSNSASRFWTLTENGSLTADLSFTYRNEDVNGDENTYKVLRRAGGMTIQSISSTNNPATNTATILGVSNFSDWGVGLAVPTAANAEISGRLVTANGEGIRNATVMLSGGSLVQPVYVRTGTFGSYTFSDVPVGQTYLITVISKRYTFANPTRVINLTDSVTDEDFIADSQ